GTFGSTAWTAAAGADDFFFRFLEVFLLPFFLPLFLFFFAGFAGDFALASGWDGGATSDWAIVAAAKHKLAAAITKSLRRCMRFAPEKVESTLPGIASPSIKAHRVCGAAKQEDRGGPATVAPDVWARSPLLPPRRPRRRSPRPRDRRCRRVPRRSGSRSPARCGRPAPERARTPGFRSRARAAAPPSASGRGRR